MALARLPNCVWLERDETGRPRCEHGWAHKAGPNWRCRGKSHANMMRFYRTERGREVKRRQNASERMRVTKALYELTRIRIGG